MARIEAAEQQRRADANLFEAFRVMCSGVPGGEVLEHDGVLIAASGLPVPMFNVAFVTRPLPDPKPVLQRAISYFDGRRIPFIVRIRDGLDQSVEAAAVALDLPFSDAVPGMILENPGKRLKKVRDLDIRVPASEQELEDFARVVAAGFDAPLEMTRALAGFARFGIPDQELYVGYHDGQAVASSTLALTHRVAGVYNVATLPTARRRGYGEAMTAHAVRRGAERGALIASLQASDMGRPVYERMGFRVTAWYRTFRRRGE